MLKPKNAFNFYENNGFGLLTSCRINEITECITVFNEKNVIQAMQTAIDRNVFNWKYVECLLQCSNDIN